MPPKILNKINGSTGTTDAAILLADGIDGSALKTSDKTIVTTLGSTDATVPTSAAVKAITDGKRNYHGFVNRTDSTITWSNSTKTLTLTGTFTYWYQGVAKTHSDSPSVTMSAGQISTAGLYYVYFDASDVLNISTVIPTYELSVFVALVYWNTSAAIVREERHGYRLSQDWRRWAHNTIGCRYGSGLALTIPVNTGYPNTTVSVATGTIWDEDIDYSSTSPATQVRTFYQNSASTLTFTDTLSAQPYKYGSTGVQFVDSTNSYALTDCASGRYVNVWVYAVPGIIPATGAYGENISIVLETIAGNAGYTTVANARAVSPPNLALLTAVSPEIKLIYRLVVKGDGTINTILPADDYRTFTTIAGGAVSTIDAASVILTPTGSISSITVQSGIAELDMEKAATNQKLDDFGTPDDNTDLNANTTNHGLVVKAVDPVTGRYRNIVAIDNAETTYTNKALFDDSVNPVMDGSAATGTQMVVARRDHIHQSDTSRAPIANPTFTGTATTPALKVTTGAADGSVLVSDADGDLVYKSPKRTVFLSLAGGWNPTTSPAGAITTTETSTNKVNYRGTLFAAGASNIYHEFAAAMPDNWNLSTITAEFYFHTTSTDASSHTIIFGLQGLAMSSGDTLDTAYGTAQEATATIASSVAGLMNKTSATSAITIGNTPTKADFVQFRVYRKGNDTFTGDVILLGVRISYGTNNYSDE